MLTTRTKRIALTAFALLFGIALLAVFVFKGSDGATDERYFALGDSFTAGMGIYPRSTEWTPSECQQSTLSYPHLTNGALGFTDFADGACSGAVIKDFYEPQDVEGGPNPPQFDLIKGTESFVTVSIGGNDAGFWGNALICLQNGDPQATPCRDKFIGPAGENLLEKRTDRVAANLEATLADLQKRAPDAKIYLIGYQQIAPSNGLGCEGYIDASVEDLMFWDQWQRYLNEKMAAAAKARGIRFIDVFEASIGHDACNPPGVRWVEPMVGHKGIIRLHPNEDGHRAMFEQIRAAYLAEQP